MSEKEKNVYPYPDGVQKRLVLNSFVTREYRVPFNYSNIKVNRVYDCRETHGMELNPVNSYIPQPRRKPADYIEISEEEPIVRVEVIGSACTPPGYVQLMFDPLPGFCRKDEARGTVACRFRINNLWGMHYRCDQYYSSVQVPRRIKYVTGEEYIGIPDGEIDWWPKTDFREDPLVGFSCAVFSIPLSGTVKIMGGCEIPGWPDDNYPDDAHYSFRIIRVTVCKVEK